MDGITQFPIIGTPRPGGHIMWGSFAPNATSTPATADFLGSLKGRFSVAYSATGIYTVTLGTGLSFPENPVILLTSQCVDMTDTNRFWVVQKGAYSNTNRTFDIQALQDSAAAASAGFAVPANAANRIAFMLCIINSTGK